MITFNKSLLLTFTLLFASMSALFAENTTETSNLYQKICPITYQEVQAEETAETLTLDKNDLWGGQGAFKIVTSKGTFYLFSEARKDTIMDQSNGIVWAYFATSAIMAAAWLIMLYIVNQKQNMLNRLSEPQFGVVYGGHVQYVKNSDSHLQRLLKECYTKLAKSNMPVAPVKTIWYLLQTHSEVQQVNIRSHQLLSKY